MKASRIAAGVSAATLCAALGFVGLATLSHSAATAATDGPTASLKVEDFLLPDQNFLAHQLTRMKDAKAIVLVATDSKTPVLKADAEKLNALKAAYADKGVELFLIDSTLNDQRPAMSAALKSAGVDLPVLFDYEQLVGEQLGLTRTGEALVINPKSMKVAYRGPLAAGGQNLAAEAIDAVSAGRAPSVAQRQATGTLIAFPEKLHSADFSKISYAKEIAPIVQQKCATCHQPGGIGPMPLNSYEQVHGFAPMIREVVRTHRMPPYLADETVGHFIDDDRLSPQQIKTLVHWVEAGAPRGSGEDPLKKINFQAPEWPLGKPDMIVKIPAFNVPSTGVIEYQRPVVKIDMPEGRWMKATTFRVDNRAVVHHILSGSVDGQPKPGDTASEATWGASLGGYGPGRGSNIAPAQLGTWMPASGGVGFQDHYTPNGKAVTEQTQMGIYFYPKGQEPKYVLRTQLIADPSIVIPAGAEFHKEQAYVTFPKDAVLYGITPHAHHRGGSTTTSIIYPDGREEMLLALPRYDFNWQYEYFLKTPIKVPAGSRIVARWTYDNSKRNPDNPNFDKVVYWGEQSDEEMLATYLHYRWTEETVQHQTPENDKLLQASLFMGMLDDDMDGKLSKAELKGKMGEMLLKYFAVIDKNKDGYLDAAEMAAAQKLLPGRKQQFAPSGPGIAPNPATPAATPAATKTVATR